MDTVKLTTGTAADDISLYYDTDAFELIASTMQFGLPTHDNLMHKSDWEDGEQLVRTRLGNREWPMRLAIRKDAAGDDDIPNTLHTLRRLVTKAHKYNILKQGDEVYLEFQPDAATNYTRYTVIDVRVEQLAFMEFMNRQAKEILFGDGCAITVVTKPQGYGAEETLANELMCPDFEKDNTPGYDLADGWNTTLDPSVSFDTSIYKVGSQSQKIDSAGIGKGIQSNSTTTSASGRSVVAYAWVYIEDPGGAPQGDEVGVSLCNYTDKTDIDREVLSTTDTWTKVSVSGTLPASKALRLCITAADASDPTTFYIDKCYLQFASTEPTAWMSSRNIYNTWANTTGYISDIYITDVKGDLPAQTKIKLESDDLHMRYIYAGIKSGDVGHVDKLIADMQDAGTTPRQYKRTSVGDTAYTSLMGSVGAPGIITENDDLDQTIGRYMMLAVTRDNANTTAGYFRGYSASSGAASQTDGKSGPSVTGWKVQTHGALSLGDLQLEGYHPQEYNFRLQAKYAAGTANIDTDLVAMMPLDQFYIADMLGQREPVVLFEDDGIPLATELVSGDFSYISNYVVGQMPELIPGEDQRLYIITSTAGQLHAIGKVSTTIYYKPCTEFFLGTI